jgi:hypothetical protein
MDETAFQNEVVPQFGHEPKLGMKSQNFYFGGGVDYWIPIASESVGAFVAFDAGFTTLIGPSFGLRLGFFADSKDSPISRKGAIREVVSEPRNPAINFLDDDLFEEEISGTRPPPQRNTSGICQSPSAGTVGWLSNVPSPEQTSAERSRRVKEIKGVAAPSDDELQEMVWLYLQQALHIQETSKDMDKVRRLVLKASALCLQLN